MNLRKLPIILLSLSVLSLNAQNEWGIEESEVHFNDTRVINGFSTCLLEKGTFDLRIGHKFGDMATPKSYQTFYGLDNSADIRIAGEYGLTDKIMLGFGRSKGAGPYVQVFDAFGNFGLISKNYYKINYTAQIFSTLMEKNEDSASVANFTKLAHRFFYNHQISFSYSISKKLVLQIAPGFNYRNLVHFEDQNTLMYIGLGTRWQCGKKTALIGEYFVVRRKNQTINGMEYVNPLGIGIEFKTHAHVFQLNLTNAKGFGAGQFIPYTQSKVKNGAFRLGFTISRHF